MANRKVTPAHFSSLFAQLRELGVQDAEIKSMEEFSPLVCPSVVPLVSPLMFPFDSAGAVPFVVCLSDAKDTIISEMANRKVTPAHFSSLFAQLRELGVQDADLSSDLCSILSE
jgi:uncharacterized protein YdcH (DUF465 family)